MVSSPTLNGTDPVTPFAATICLVTTQKDSFAAKEFMDQLVVRGVHQDNILLITAPPGKKNADHTSPISDSGHYSPPEISPLLAALKSMAGRPDDQALIVLRIGTEVPTGWIDLLLHATRLHNRVGAVSPLTLDLLSTNYINGHESSLSVDELSTRLFLHGSRSGFQVNTILECCALFTPSAVAVLSAGLHKDIIPENSHGNDLANILERHGLISIVCDYLFVRENTESTSSKPPPALGIPGGLNDYWKACTGRASDGLVLATLPGINARPVQLHIAHAWGGGLGHWVESFCQADKQRINLILQPIKGTQLSASKYVLIQLQEVPRILRTWTMHIPIHGTAIAHLHYATMLEEILSEYCVDAILISSLIGHSLDVLKKNLPTLYVCHDFYPICAAICLYHHGVCDRCDKNKLKACFSDNPFWLKFPKATPDSWINLREAFVEALLTSHVPLVAPCNSTLRHWFTLEPRTSVLPHYTIPHGLSWANIETSTINTHEGRLRVVILGSLQPHKGLGLLESVIDQLTLFVDLYLVGSGEYGVRFKNKNHVTLIKNYQSKDLQVILRALRPDLGLLLSIWPETFSYTLSELFALGVPVLATRLGAFADRIEDGVTGWLFEPNPESLVNILKALDKNRTAITNAAENLKRIPQRGLDVMLKDYHELIFLPEKSPSRFQLNRLSKHQPSPLRGSININLGLTVGELLWSAESFLQNKLKYTNLCPWTTRVISSSLIMFFLFLRLIRKILIFINRQMIKIC